MITKILSVSIGMILSIIFTIALLDFTPAGFYSLYISAITVPLFGFLLFKGKYKFIGIGMLISAILLIFAAIIVTMAFSGER